MSDVIPIDGANPNSGFGAYIFAKDIDKEADLSRDWLVKGVLAKGGIYQVYGTWKSGKSLLILDMAAHLATDLDWAGHKSLKTLVVWVAGESAQDTKERLKAFMLRNKVAGEDMAFVLREKPVYLTQLDYAVTLHREIESLKTLFPGLPILLVIDTLNRNYGPGASENSDEDMGAFTANLIDTVARPTKATVIVVHHSGHGDKDRGRGHSSFPAAVDGTLKVEKSGTDPEFVTLVGQEQRNVKSGNQTCFRIDVQELPFTDNFGDQLEAPVLQHVDDAPAVKQPGMGKIQKACINLLDELYEQHRANLEGRGLDGDGARVSLDGWRDAIYDQAIFNGADKRKSFSRMKKALLDRGSIRVEGPYVYLV